MAAITATSIQAAGAVTVTRTTLGASDTLTYNPYTKAILVLDNVTGGALTPNIDGAGGTTINVPTVGSLSVASGLTLASIGAGACVSIRLDSIAAYLSGVVTITGGDGIKAHILEQS
jgi:hypothetical protein